MLLDEPTNHLSILAVMWLARELSTSDTWKDRIVVIVSHDRHFMDEVCTDCLHISGAAKRLTQARGNYSTCIIMKKEKSDRHALLRHRQSRWRIVNNATDINKQQCCTYIQVMLYLEWLELIFKTNILQT